MFTFGVKGGYEAGISLVRNLKLFSHLANIGDTRSLVIHPASTTHSQLTDAQKTAAGAGPDVVRLSIGIEDVADLIADLDQALQGIGARGPLASQVGLVIMKKPIPSFKTDEEAEQFVDTADLSEYDLSGSQLVRFELRPWDRRRSICAHPRSSSKPSAAARSGHRIPYQRFIRMAQLERRAAEIRSSDRPRRAPLNASPLVARQCTTAMPNSSIAKAWCSSPAQIGTTSRRVTIPSAACEQRRRRLRRPRRASALSRRRARAATSLPQSERDDDIGKQPVLQDCTVYVTSSKRLRHQGDRTNNPSGISPPSISGQVL